MAVNITEIKNDINNNIKDNNNNEITAAKVRTTCNSIVDKGLSVLQGDIKQSDWNQTNATQLDFIKNKPSTFTPSTHTHTNSQIDNFALDAPSLPLPSNNVPITSANFKKHIENIRDRLHYVMNKDDNTVVEFNSQSEFNEFLNSIQWQLYFNSASFIKVQINNSNTRGILFVTQYSTLARTQWLFINAQISNDKQSLITGVNESSLIKRIGYPGPLPGPPIMWYDWQYEIKGDDNLYEKINTVESTLTNLIGSIDIDGIPTVSIPSQTPLPQIPSLNQWLDVDPLHILPDPIRWTDLLSGGKNIIKVLTDDRVSLLILNKNDNKVTQWLIGYHQISTNNKVVQNSSNCSQIKRECTINTNTLPTTYSFTNWKFIEDGANNVYDLINTLSGGGTIIPAATDAVLGGIKANAKGLDVAGYKADPKINSQDFLEVTIPQATENTFGVVKAKAKTSNETEEVTIDATTGKLYVKDNTPFQSFNSDSQLNNYLNAATWKPIFDSGQNFIKLQLNAGNTKAIFFVTQLYSPTGAIVTQWLYINAEISLDKKSLVVGGNEALLKRVGTLGTLPDTFIWEDWKNIDTPNDPTITLHQNDKNIDTFTLNQANNKTIILNDGIPRINVSDIDHLKTVLDDAATLDNNSIYQIIIDDDDRSTLIMNRGFGNNTTTYTQWLIGSFGINYHDGSNNLIRTAPTPPNIVMRHGNLHLGKIQWGSWRLDRGIPTLFSDNIDYLNNQLDDSDGVDWMGFLEYGQNTFTINMNNNLSTLIVNKDNGYYSQVLIGFFEPSISSGLVQNPNVVNILTRSGYLNNSVIGWSEWSVVGGSHTHTMIDIITPDFTNDLHTISPNDFGKLIEYKGNANVQIKVPQINQNMVLIKGVKVHITRRGNGEITIIDENTGAMNVISSTLEYKSGLLPKVEKYGTATLIHFANNEWLLDGGLELEPAP